MFDTIRRYMEAVTDRKTRENIEKIVTPIGDRLSSQPLTTAGLLISSGGATTAKTGGSTFYAVVAGKILTISASTTLPALTGISIAAGSFNVVCFFLDGGGTVTAVAGTQAATLAKVTFPSFPKNKALVGFLVITYASAFVGGTTPLDTATTTYFSPTWAAFEPTVLTG